MVINLLVDQILVAAEHDKNFFYHCQNCQLWNWRKAVNTLIWGLLHFIGVRLAQDYQKMLEVLTFCWFSPRFSKNCWISSSASIKRFLCLKGNITHNFPVWYLHWKFKNRTNQKMHFNGHKFNFDFYRFRSSTFFKYGALNSSINVSIGSFQQNKNYSTLNLGFCSLDRNSVILKMLKFVIVCDFPRCSVYVSSREIRSIINLKNDWRVSSFNRNWRCNDKITFEFVAGVGTFSGKKTKNCFLYARCA